MWWKDAVIYELYVDKFAGDFAGLAKKLDYLKNLGANTVHILPHYPSPMVDDGYDVSDYKGVRTELGTLEDFKKMSERAHSMGIKIIIDLVLNHASVENPLFIEAAMNKDSEASSMFLWSETGTEYSMAGNVFSKVKPSNWVRNMPSGYFYFSTFYPEQADFDWNNPKVFAFFTDIMDFWVAMGADGFRLDAAPHLIKKEGTDCKGLPEVHEILVKLRSHIDKNYPEVVLLAEADDTLPKMKAFFGTGEECHLIYNFDLNKKLMFALVADEKTIFDSAVAESLAIPEKSAWANFLRNHDDLSLLTLAPGDIKKIKTYFDPDRRFGFENNIAVRLASMFNGNKEKIITAFKWLFSAPGAHIIYYGDELGMENEAVGKGEDMRRTVRGKFDWAKAEKDMNDPSSLFNAVKKIIAERKSGEK